MKKINSKEIILAEVRRYDKKLGGLVIEDYKPYALIINKNGKYYNIFNDKEELPLLARVPYNNYTKDVMFFKNGYFYSIFILTKNKKSLKPTLLKLSKNLTIKH